MLGTAASMLWQFSSSKQISVPYRCSLSQYAHAAAGSRGLRFCRRYRLRSLVLVIGETSELDHGEDDGEDDDWEIDMLEEFEGVPSRSRRRKEKQFETVKEDDNLDGWAHSARSKAIEAAQARRLSIGALMQSRKKTKKQKKKLKVGEGEKRRRANIENRRRVSEKEAVDSEVIKLQAQMGNPLLASLGAGEGFQELAQLGNYWKSLSSSSSLRDNVQFADMKASTAADALKPKANSFEKDYELNRKLVQAVDANDVLQVVGYGVANAHIGLDDYELSPLNVSTALHRIGRHMENSFMIRSDRLAFARRKEMAWLVGLAMDSLESCSAQGVSNIAWSLSKVGGSSLYSAEMDLIAQASMKKMSEFNSQNIANIAGAYASMQHSVGPLFEALANRAVTLHGEFQPQEVAQLLWAFASLYQTADPILDSLDSRCTSSAEKLQPRSMNSTDFRKVGNPISQNTSVSIDTKEMDDAGQEMWSETDEGIVGIAPGNGNLEICNQIGLAEEMYPNAFFHNCDLGQLASLSWSYTVLNQLHRPFFKHVWTTITSRVLISHDKVPGKRLQSWHLSQIYQTNLSLKLEYAELSWMMYSGHLEKLAVKEWEREKKASKAISVTQREVDRLLTATGKEWMVEYNAADYTLDAALVAERVALEIDGPSHFARNTGTPLGHTLLKRRHLRAAGWKVLSIPFQEWEDLDGEEQQKSYLRSLLQSFPCL